VIKAVAVYRVKGACRVYWQGHVTTNFSINLSSPYVYATRRQARIVNQDMKAYIFKTLVVDTYKVTVSTVYIG